MGQSPKPPPSSELTPEAVYLRRRAFLRDAGLFVAASSGIGAGLVALTGRKRASSGGQAPGGFPALTPSDFDAREPLTSYEDVTTYNNFYELGTSKSDPSRNGASLKPRPWSVEITGLVKKPRTVDLDSLLGGLTLEDRVYRMRCVEAWSMVIPWRGFPLSALLSQVEPLGSARYVAFTTLLDPEQLPGQKRDVLEWPYREGLRLDEAMHPLTLMATGLYGKDLPNQNGAPLRLVVPWKYGFKGIKSIVRLELTDKEPVTSWNQSAPGEYGFYANVNPAVDHPRWSQATERRIGQVERRATLPFNGYAEQVASLYAGMDLKRLY